MKLPIAKLFPAMYYMISHAVPETKFSSVREVGTLPHNTIPLETLDVDDRRNEINDISIRTYGATMKGGRGLTDIINNIFLPLLVETGEYEAQEQEILSIRKKFNYNTSVELEKRGISSGSTFYIESAFNNTLPSSLLNSFPNRTEISSFDVGRKFKDSWKFMNSKTANGTNTAQPDPENPNQRDMFVPPGTMLGSPFDHSTAGAYITTDHYKAVWKSSDVGNLRFSKDKSLVPFFLLEESYPFYETANYSAVRIPLKGGKQILSLVLPKVSIHETALLRNDLENSAINASKKSYRKLRKVQLPTLDITGWNRATRLEMTENFKLEICRYSEYCLGPIPQAVYLKFKPDSLEVSSATGITVQKSKTLSEEELHQILQKIHGISEDDTEDDNDTGIPSVKLGVQDENIDSSSESESHDDTNTEISDEETNTEFSDEETNTDESDEDEASPFFRQQKSRKRSRSFKQTSDEIMRFDKPFFWYLMDDGIEIYSGIVDSINLDESVASGPFAWLTVLEKVYLWSGLGLK